MQPNIIVIKYKYHIIIFLCNTIFAVNSLVSKDVLYVLNPNILTSSRFLIAVILFWIVSLFIKIKGASIKDIGLLFLASMFGIVGNILSIVLGLNYTTPTISSITISTTPIFTMIMAMIFLKEKITFRKCLAIVVALSGVIILIFSHSDNSLVASNNILGIVCCLMSCITYAIYLTLFAPLIKRNHPIEIMKWMFLFSCLMVIPFTYKEILAFDYSILSLGNYIQVAYSGIFATFLAYIMIPIAQKHLQPTTLSMYNYTQPIVTTILAVIFSVEVFTTTKFFAIVLVCTGVYIKMKDDK